MRMDVAGGRGDLKGQGKRREGMRVLRMLRDASLVDKVSENSLILIQYPQTYDQPFRSSQIKGKNGGMRDKIK